MNEDTVKLLGIVALTEALPKRNLKRGQVGTVVELLAPDVFEVEFADAHGHAYQLLPLQADPLLPLLQCPGSGLKSQQCRNWVYSNPHG